MSDPTASVQALLDARPMRALQLRVVALCALVNILDGFDLLAISFAAPAISRAWQLGPQTLGIVFSSGLVGMALGSLVFGPAADRIGRRHMIVLATVVLGLSTLATSVAHSVGQLLALRCMTGLAIGALLPSLNTLVAEYTPDRRRNLAVSAMHLGYPVGGVAGGVLAAYLIPLHGWQSVFLVGGAITLLMAPVLLLALPESLPYLLRRGTPAARQAAARLADRLQLNLTGLADAPAPAAADGIRGLVRGSWLKPGLALWAAFFLGNLTLYFLLNWTPTVLTQAGLSTQQAIRAGVALNVGGGLGMLALGYLSARWSLHRMMAGYFVGGSVLIMALGQAPGSVAGMLGLAVMAGFFAVGGLIGLYALAARLYPAHVRASGVGLAISAGRLGAILGPYLGGVLIQLGWPMSRYYVLLALPLLGVALVIRAIRPPAQAVA